MKKIFFLLLTLLMFSTICLGQDSIDYINATPEDLEQSIKENASKVVACIDESSIRDGQSAVDFARYLSEMRNLLFYSTHLANYHAWQEDLEFAKAKGLYKGLLEDDWTPDERMKFADSKFKAMRKNVHKEIQTYEDCINMALDTCETLNHDPIFIETIINNEEYRKRMESFLEGHIYKGYESAKKDLKGMRPDLSGKIEAVVAVWKAKSTSNPDVPIIDPQIVDKL